MKAIVTTAFGKPPVTAIEERARPTATPGHSVVRMRAATINQLSRFIREGDVADRTAPIVLGNEGSGSVEEGGRFAPGTRVGIYGGNTLGITRDGLFQEYVLVEDHRLFALPDELSWEAGATLSVNYLTAYRALTHSVQVREGQSIIVSGATGSVGSAVAQVGKALGVRTIALVSSTEKVRRAEAVGADAAVDLSTADDVPAAVRALTDGRGADYAFDPVGGSVLSQLIGGLRFRGTLVSLGFAGGMAPPLPAYDLIANEKRIVGYALHAERDEDVVAPLEELVRLAQAGKLEPAIDSSYGIDDYDDAYRRLASRQAMGSIVLTFPSKPAKE